MSDRPRARAVLLDIDGTLIDSNEAHARSWVETFAEFGYDVPFDKVRPLIGMGGDKLLALAVGVEEKSEEGKRMSKRRRERFLSDYLPTLRPFPKARALVERMRDEGLTVVVATSANEDEMTPLLERAGVADIVEAALERAGQPAEAAVMLGDTPYDIEAAGRAGVAVIAFRCGNWWTDEDLAGAVAIYDGPADLLANFDRAPLVGNGR